MKHLFFVFFSLALYLTILNPLIGETIEGQESTPKDGTTLYPSKTIEKDSNQQTTPGEVKFRLTGMLKTDFAYANKSVLSFGFDNLVGPTVAKRQVQARDSEPRSGIYPTSSLLGVEILYGTKAKAIFEADFVDVTKSSVGAETKPRVRQMYFQYNPSTKIEFFLGRTWDLFAGVYPQSYNASAFMSGSGNIGWQREQIGLWYQLGDVKLGSAIGTTGFHNDPNVKTNIERNSMPTIAVRMDWKPSSQFFFTTSAIGTKLKVSDPSTDSARDGLALRANQFNDPNQSVLNALAQKETNQRSTLDSGGVSIGFVWKQGNFESRGEISYGTNLTSITSSGIAPFQTTTYGEEFTNSRLGFLSGEFSNDAKSNTKKKFESPRELTGFLSLNYDVSKQFGFGIHTGVSKITNPEVLVGADFNALSMSRPDSFQWTSNPRIMGAMRENLNYGFRMNYDPEEKIRFFLQTDVFRTYYKDVERYQGVSAHIGSYDPMQQTGEWRDPGNKSERSSAVAESLMIRLGGLFRFDT
ncbi:hypothetical protein [Leptospira biflexa]|uniref:hypothetical protein n=1 Tax=Leptospira biflexa TaxID=172 RepID=UPI0010846FDA|nr:hypothetical protein [Leptospira biflexa]TGM34268.1 hypothetical protein EHQ89_13820 [Leptospira biflexa]TGM40075.1 hypothetical protein EHQ80_02515 [Leptospira biflexa]